jgi:hypothetical protein
LNLIRDLLLWFYLLTTRAMKVYELIKELERFDWDKEIKLRVWYNDGKDDVFFDFRVWEESWFFEGCEPFVKIESEVDIDDFLIDRHGCEWC